MRENRSFEVVVWRCWPCEDLPVVEVVVAPTAFEAVEQVMWGCGWQTAGHAGVAALDGSLVYRAYGIWLASVRAPVEQLAWWHFSERR